MANNAESYFRKRDKLNINTPSIHQICHTDELIFLLIYLSVRMEMFSTKSGSWNDIGCTLTMYVTLSSRPSNLLQVKIHLSPKAQQWDMPVNKTIIFQVIIRY